MDQVSMQPQNPTTTGGNNQKKLITIIAVVLVVIILGWVGSRMFGRSAGERAAEQAIERATGGKVDVDFKGNDTVTYKSEDGEAQVNYGGNVSLPKDWPSDISIMPDAKINYSSVANPSSGEAVTSLMFTTSKSTPEVAAYYSSELVSKGWNIENTATVSGTTIFSAKKDTRIISMSIVNSDGVTTATITVQKE